MDQHERQDDPRWSELIFHQIAAERLFIPDPPDEADDTVWRFRALRHELAQAAARPTTRTWFEEYQHVF